MYCRKCKDKSFLIECKCGCGGVRPLRGNRGRVYYYINHHGATGREATKWKNGGRFVDSDGYIQIWFPDHPFVQSNNYVREHRLVMEKYLGRYLDPYEVVHHIDGNHSNNDISNLQLFASHSEHTYYEMSLEVNKDKVSKANKGKKLSETHKIKIGDSMKGNKNGYGKHWHLVDGKRVY